MMINKWHMYSLEVPNQDGIYEVRLTKKYDLLSSPIETIMEYRNGEWIMRVPIFINEYTVYAWREMN